MRYPCGRSASIRNGSARNGSAIWSKRAKRHETPAAHAGADEERLAGSRGGHAGFHVRNPLPRKRSPALPPTHRRSRPATRVTARSSPNTSTRHGADGVTMPDHTYDAAVISWVDSANGHDSFPIQNLPLGIFSTKDGKPRAGVGIGDGIVDIAATHTIGLLQAKAAAFVSATACGTLNAALALSAGLSAPRCSTPARGSARTRPSRATPSPHRGLPAAFAHRHRRLHRFLRRYPPRASYRQAVPPRQSADAELQMDPDRLPRPGFVRAWSVTPVRRPNGQTKAPDLAQPTVGPCQQLDYELELAVWIGPGNDLGAPIPIGDAGAHIAGYGLLNDWSARDI